MNQSPPTSASLSTFDRLADSSQRTSQVYTPPLFASDTRSSGIYEGGGGFDQVGNDEGSERDEEQVITQDLYRIAAVAGLGGLLFGFDTGVVSGALLSLSEDSSPLPPLSTSQESFLVTSALIGALFSSLFAGRLADSDKLGRKGVIVTSAVLFTLGAAEMAAAQVYKEIILGRVLVGFGVGLASCVLPTYLAELSPPKFRGRIVASLVVLITGGQVVAYLISLLCFHFFPISSSSQQAWRWMFGFGTVPSLLQLILSFSLPESPRYLFRKGKTAKGRKVLKRLNPGWSSERVQREVEKLIQEVNKGTPKEPERIEVEQGEEEKWYKVWMRKLKKLKRINWKEKSQEWRRRSDGYKELLWNDRGNRRTLTVACGLQLFQQATGFNCLMYYSTKVIQQTHLSSPATFALLIAISNFLCTLIALRLIDRTGRRKLLLRGLIGMIMGMMILSISFAFIREVDSEEGGGGGNGGGAAAVMSLIGMTGFCCAYALSLGNVPWIVQSEVFVPELKALGTGLSTSVNWAGNIFVSSTFLHISQGIGPSGAFGLFAMICLAGWIFTYCLLPETKGLTLEQVRSLFENDSDKTSTSRSRGDHSRSRGDDEEAGLMSGNGYHVLGETEVEEEEEEENGDTSGGSENENEARRTRRKGIV
ncbi:hypothetical protein JCM3765_006631 [Sporobolomyces pararoseus]